VVRRAQAARGNADWQYSLDFNEGCPNVAYLLEFLRRIRETTPDGFTRILYIEQPTARDLARDRANVMHEASRLRPVVIDESLTGLDALLLAREMGYTGVALKACKGQSQAMLMAAAAQKFGMFLCVQDLTCPGASLMAARRSPRSGPGRSGSGFTPPSDRGTPARGSPRANDRRRRCGPRRRSPERDEVGGRRAGRHSVHRCASDGRWEATPAWSAGSGSGRTSWHRCW